MIYLSLRKPYTELHFWLKSNKFILIILLKKWDDTEILSEVIVYVAFHMEAYNFTLKLFLGARIEAHLSILFQNKLTKIVKNKFSWIWKKKNKRMKLSYRFLCCDWYRLSFYWLLLNSFFKRESTRNIISV